MIIIGPSPGGMCGLPAGEATPSCQANTGGGHPQRPDSIYTDLAIDGDHGLQATPAPPSLPHPALLVVTINNHNYHSITMTISITIYSMTMTEYDYEYMTMSMALCYGN